MPPVSSTLVWKLVMCYLCTIGQAVEPQCSKFPYEEALLEKMVRIEFKVEQMVETNKANEAKVTEELATLRQHCDSLDRITNANTKAVDGLTGRVNVNLQQNDAKISKISMEMAAFQQLKGPSKTTPILFRARSVVEKSPKKDQIMVFSVELEDIGGGYNEKTGIFTAPSAGVYLFTVQLCSHQDTEINIAFVKDNVVEHRCQIEGRGNSCGTSSLVTTLDTGSTVCLKSTHDHSNRRLYADDVYRWSVFSGVILH